MSPRRFCQRNFGPAFATSLGLRAWISARRPITTAVFDLGAVLIDWDPRHLYRGIFDDEEAMEHFLDTVCTAEWNAEQDRGRSLAEATTQLIAEHPPTRRSHRGLLRPVGGDGWRADRGHGRDRARTRRTRRPAARFVELVGRDVSDRPPAAGVSRRLRRRAALRPRGTDQARPGDLPAARPPVRPSTSPGAVFVDDSAKNVEAAAALGFDASDSCLRRSCARSLLGAVWSRP